MRTAIATDKEAVKPRAQWWDTTLKETCDAFPGAPLDGVGAATSARAAVLSGQTLGRGLMASEILEYSPLAPGTKDRELAARKKFDVPRSVDRCVPTRSIVGARRALMWRSINATKARFVAKGFRCTSLSKRLAETAGCVAVRPLPPRLITLSAFWEMGTSELRF